MVNDRRPVTFIPADQYKKVTNTLSKKERKNRNLHQLSDANNKIVKTLESLKQANGSLVQLIGIHEKTIHNLVELLRVAKGYIIDSKIKAHIEAEINRYDTIKGNTKDETGGDRKDKGPSRQHPSAGTDKDAGPQDKNVVGDNSEGNPSSD